MKCEILLEDRTGSTVENYKQSGNVFLDHLYGANVQELPGGTDMNAAMAGLADELRAKGQKAVHHPWRRLQPDWRAGLCGVRARAGRPVQQPVDLNVELPRFMQQAAPVRRLVWWPGLEGTRSQIPVLGIGVRAAKEAQETNVYNLAVKTADLLGVAGSIKRESVMANCDYVGGGYGVPTPGMIEAVTLVARLEGILLDPVYSGKGMAGLIDLCRKGHFKKGENVVFLHTGGAVALYGYMDAFGDLTPV
jgi:L-cysteate sulfo-lyase